MDSQEDCDEMFLLASQGYDIEMNAEQINLKLNVPLLPNCMGLQPLDYAMGSTKIIDLTDDRYAEIDLEELSTISNSKNLPLV